MRTLRTFLRFGMPVLTLFAALLMPTRAATAGQVITLDTSFLAGESGYLDFEFNPDFSAVPPASAIVSDFTTDGSIDASTASTMGYVSGDVSSPSDSLTISNNDGGNPPTLSQFNDYNVGFTFGSTITFNLDFTGGAGTSGYGSGFTLTFYASDDATPLLGPNTDGTYSAVSVTLNPNPDGVTTTITTYINPQLVAASVPEPSTLILGATGALGLLALRRSRRGSIS